MNQLVKANPFAEALATLKADFPATFALEVDARVFREVGSFEQAHLIARTMEGMKREAGELGYHVITRRDYNPIEYTDRWVYNFYRHPDAKKPEADDSLPVEIVHLGEDSV